MKLYIIANRLPVKVSITPNGDISLTRSEGGLATGLSSLNIRTEIHWIGWPGICTDDENVREKIRTEMEKMDFHPVFLSDSQYLNYYEGYSNSTIWPLCHYFYAYTQYNKNYWEYYREVNSLFFDEVANLAEGNDKVWVQDYHLMLLPGLLRDRFPNMQIGYFHHIPFPSYELFRILPERDEILKGLMGADFIGFHTHDYVRHFISAAERVLGLNFKLEETRIGNRTVRVDALPMGINYELFHGASQNENIRKKAENIREKFHGNNNTDSSEQCKMIISVDRLDYSKGILHRLKSFASFLEHHPEYREKVVLVMVLVPSRDQVDSYAELKTAIDKETGSINGRFSTIDWTPVYYFYHGFPFEDLAAMYLAADIALVTPLRDGMNLVAKEYIAARNADDGGVLILSEMAGAAVELSEALIINPNDRNQVENAIYEALQMAPEEQSRRIRKMQEIVSKQTVNKWAADFMEEWRQTVNKNIFLQMKVITKESTVKIKKAYSWARRRLIILDYDGTLAPFCNRPEDARPSGELMSLLRKLTDDPCNHVVINSGRDHQTLEKWLGSVPVSFAAEHGAFYKENGMWHRNVNSHDSWSEGILSIMKMFVDKTPKSSLEFKSTSLAWHYRESDTWLGEFRAHQLINSLVDICLKQKLQILHGNKVVEIKHVECNKGTETSRLLKNGKYDFIMAIGDDVTDEDMFEALPEEAFTIKVGVISDKAHFCIPNQKDVLPFLESISEKSKYGDGHNRIIDRVALGMNYLKKKLIG